MNVSRKFSPVPVNGFTRPQFSSARSSQLRKHHRIERQFYYVSAASKVERMRTSRRTLVSSSRLSNYSSKECDSSSIHDRSALDSLIQDYEKENKAVNFPLVRKQRGLSEANAAEQHEAMLDYFTYQPKISRMNRPRVISKQIHFKCQANRMREYLSPEYKYT